MYGLLKAFFSIDEAVKSIPILCSKFWRVLPQHCSLIFA